MIDVALLSAIAGAISGFALARLFGQQLMLVLYHAPFRFWRPYSTLYERLGTQYSYELLGGNKSFKNRQAFTSLHEKHRYQVNDRFKRLWNAYVTKIAQSYLLVLLVALVLLWGVYWPFIVSFVLVQLISLSYDRYAKNQDLDLHVTLMLSLLISEY